MAILYFLIMVKGRSIGFEISDTAFLLVGLLYIGDMIFITRRSKDGK